MIHQIGELLDTAPCGFLSFADDGTVVAVNITLLKLLEYEALQGRSIDAILPIASRIFYQTHFFPLLKLQGTVKEVYFSLRTQQGKAIPMLVNAVRREDPEICLNHCIFIPIHQRIQYEEELLQAKKTAEIAIKAQKKAEIALRQQYDTAILLGEITQNIRKSLDLQAIFATAVLEIRQFIGADRVGIFKFVPYSNFDQGEFVAESVAIGFDSVIATKIIDHCFGENFALYYQQGRLQSLEDIDQAGLADCHYQVLKQFQIRANLVAPLLNNGQLWGLLCIHQCSSPRSWQVFEIDLLQQIASQLAIAIHQADLFNKLQKELAERQKAEDQLIEMNQQLARSNAELSQATYLLEQLVNTDGLTQIANRRYFDDRLQQEWDRLYREQQPLSLLLFDIDHFKRYNDTYGHQKGDNCLTQIAQAIQKVVSRSTDLVARYGGEEFAVILPHSDSFGAEIIAQRIHQALKDLNIPCVPSEIGKIVTLSLGIATCIPSKERSPALLITHADRALYLAKHQGRNRSVVFSG